MKKSLLSLALALACATPTLAADAARSPDSAYERMVDGRIAVNYYNNYLQDIIVKARDDLVDELTNTMAKLDKFVAAGKYDRGSPGFLDNWRNAKNIATIPTRIPNWYSDADQKLLKTGLDAIRTDTAELLKICETLQPYFEYNGGWKDDKCQKYIDAKPRLQSLVGDLRKNLDALDHRALEMAQTGEKLFWEQDKSLGYFVSTMKTDVDNAIALDALVQNPDLQKTGNTAAADTLPKVEKLLAALKDSRAKNAALTTPALSDDLKKQKDHFYNLSLKTFIDHVEQDTLPALQKGVLKERDAYLRSDNVGRAYDDFIAYYTRDGGIAIKYKRP